MTDRLVSLAWRLAWAARVERHYLEIEYEDHGGKAALGTPARREAKAWHELVDEELAQPPGCRPPQLAESPAVRDDH